MSMFQEDLDRSEGLRKSLVRDARKADREDTERAEQFVQMLKSEAWALYRALLEQKIQECSDLLMTPAGSQDGLVKLAESAAMMRGLIVAKDLPNLIIATAPRTSAEEDDDHAH